MNNVRMSYGRGDQVSRCNCADFREESFLEAGACDGNAKYFHTLSCLTVTGRDLTSPLYSRHLPRFPIKREVIGDLKTFTDLDLMPESILSDSFNFLF